MDFENKIRRIEENQRIKNRLSELGIYPTSVQEIVGPTEPQGEIGPTGPKGDTGPQGTGLSIEGSFDTLDELKKTHPTGNIGDCYIVQGVLYIWDEEKQDWINIGNIKGPKGDTGEKGEQGLQGPIGPQGEKSEQGEVGPTGPKGDIGPTGPKGDTGPQGPTSPTGYDAIAFASLMDTKKAGTVLLGNTRIMPGNNNSYFAMENGTDIVVKRTSVFEIVLCGRISGVTQNTGASFSLINTETNDVISDLVFVLEAGNTPDMDFSEMTVVDIYGPARLQVKTTINGSDEISFSEMNVLLKSYSV